jgi:hypothetical protein
MFFGQQKRTKKEQRKEKLTFLSGSKSPTSSRFIKLADIEPVDQH